MRSTKDIMLDLVTQPWRDDIRIEYAQSVAVKDPMLARYIKGSVERADQSGPPGDESLAVANRIASTVTLKKFRLYRGFIEEIWIDPCLFLEQGERILDSNPIRHVHFEPPFDGKFRTYQTMLPSPVPELVTSPLLRRLRSVSFEPAPDEYWRFEAEDLERIVSCPYWDSLLWFRADHIDPSLPGTDWWDRFYADPRFRKLLRLELGGDVDRGATKLGRLADDPAERRTDVLGSDARIISGSPMTEFGHALEARYGYLPSLHYAENRYSMFEATRRYERHQAPRFPVGAPVTLEMQEQPAPDVYPYNWE